MDNIFVDAIGLVFQGDRELFSAVMVSLKVSLSATIIASLISIPLGLFIGSGTVRGKSFWILLFNTMMGIPTVVIGLVCYSLLSRSGLLGELGLLYSTQAMVIGQVVLAFPLMTALSINTALGIDARIKETALALGATSLRAIYCVFSETRLQFFSVIAAGFGRLIAEVGVSLMLGGNIRFFTRNMTTAIALETSRGEFALGLSLGIILLIVAFTVNVVFYFFKGKGGY